MPLSFKKLRRPLTGWGAANLTPRFIRRLSQRTFNCSAVSSGNSSPAGAPLSSSSCRSSISLKFIPQLNGEILRKELFHGESNHLPATAFRRTLFCPHENEASEPLSWLRPALIPGSWKAERLELSPQLEATIFKSFITIGLSSICPAYSIAQNLTNKPPVNTMLCCKLPLRGRL
jgi:hypothetical protein